MAKLKEPRYLLVYADEKGKPRLLDNGTMDIVHCLAVCTFTKAEIPQAIKDYVDPGESVLAYLPVKLYTQAVSIQEKDL